MDTMSDFHINQTASLGMVIGYRSTIKDWSKSLAGGYEKDYLKNQSKRYYHHVLYLAGFFERAWFLTTVICRENDDFLLTVYPNNSPSIEPDHI